MAIKCGAYASETESTLTARGNAWSKCVRAQRERGGLSIGPGVVMAATHFAIATVAVMATARMMEIHGCLENAGIKLLL